MMKRLFLSILIIVITNNFVFTQSTYFNISYNPNNTFSIGLSVIEYNDSYFFSGVTEDSLYPDRSVFIGKAEVNGELVYWRTYGGYPYAYWAGYTNSLIASTSGDLILAGTRDKYGYNGHAIYYNFNVNGDTNFTKRYPDTTYLDYTIFNQCKQTSDNRIIFIGSIAVEQYNSDVLLLKTDYNGQEEWRSKYGKPPIYSLDKGYNVIETSDGGYLIGFYYYFATNIGTGDPYILKVDENGVFQWELNLGGPYEDLLVTVCESNDGNYMCAASISDTTFDDLLLTKVHLTKVSTEGEVLWSKTVGDQHLWNKVHGIYPDHSDGYILCGYRHDDVNGMDWMNSCGWICKIDEYGDSIWWREYEHFNDLEWHMNNIYDLHLTSDGGYIATGQTMTVYDPQQMWLLKVDSFGCDTPGCQSVGILEPQNISKGTFLIYPNPAIERINCRIHGVKDKGLVSVYNLYGLKQDEVVVPKGQKEIQI
ncbi:MAG: hypothetical protein KAR09_09450, partial [Bacteroidales bacterium]|nr:hypothetical protein [Bacteroidales bacterium]